MVSIMNETQLDAVYPNPSVFEPVETITQVHAINSWEIILISIGFVFLAYWYIKVTKNKEYYESWTNPNGSTINLYKKVRLFFWLYVGVVIVLGTLQIVTV